MGLFSSSRYTKEGPGVYADDPKRGPFFRFFQTYGNKFFKILSTNFLLVIFNIPAIILGFLGVIYVLPQINPLFEPAAFQKYLTEAGVVATESATATDGTALQLYFLLVVFLVMFIVGMQLISVGPVQTGFSYVYRNYARESTTFLWSDFVSSFKSNWKQSTIATFISIFMTGLITANIVFYSNIYEGKFGQVFSAIFFMVFVFYMCVQIYVYPLIASLNLSLKNIYKNAVLFFLGRLLSTLGIFLVDVIVLMVIPLVMLFSFTYAGFALALLYYLLFAFSFVQYLNTFFVWQQIERYIVKPQETDKQSPEADGQLPEAAKQSSGVARQSPKSIGRH